jgi:hypothetical protein
LDQVSARGTIDLSGEHPRIDITDLDAGSLPGFATGLLEDELESLVNDELDKLTLDRAYDVTFTETRAELRPAKAGSRHRPDLRPFRRRREASAMSSTAALKASSLAFDGAR